MNSDIKNRLLIFVKSINSNPRRFSVSIGKSDSYLRTMKEGIGSDAIGDILRIYPMLNINWLITGEGNMLVSETAKEPSMLSEELNLANKKYIELKEDYQKVLIELGRYKERLSKYEVEVKSKPA